MNNSEFIAWFSVQFVKVQFVKKKNIAFLVIMVDNYKVMGFL